jgi:hypothetical protein
MVELSVKMDLIAYSLCEWFKSYIRTYCVLISEDKKEKNVKSIVQNMEL